VRLRPAETTDAELCYRIFASTREQELAMAGLPPAQVESLLRMQFGAQDQQYRATHPQAEDSVIVIDGRPVGQLRIARDGTAFHLLDIALLPDHRGRGTGTALILRLQEEAAAAGVPLRLHVARTNPATSLYARLGFEPHGGDALYQAMTWTAVTLTGAAG
jgi:ribosomal protein S18 acetylase RimI-like enzyme